METSSSLFASNKPITGIVLLVCARETEGYGFIEFDISNSTISTVFRQPLIVILILIVIIRITMIIIMIKLVILVIVIVNVIVILVIVVTMTIMIILILATLIC